MLGSVRTQTARLEFEQSAPQTTHKTNRRVTTHTVDKENK